MNVFMRDQQGVGFLSTSTAVNQPPVILGSSGEHLVLLGSHHHLYFVKVFTLLCFKETVL